MTQLLADMYGASPLIEDEGAVVAAAKAGAGIVGATVVGEISVRYVPHGLTVAVFLAESHLVLTTWPEFRLLMVDVLLCNPTMDHHRVVDEIARRLCPNGEVIRHDVARVIAAAPV